MILQSPESFKEQYKFDVLTYTLINTIDRKAHSVKTVITLGWIWKVTPNDVFLHHTIYKQLNFITMKSLIKKNENEATAKVAQCCAKISKTVAGCHD